MTKKKTKKPVIVSRKFLTDLANRIYNPKTKSFLKLCAETLKNGPDPDDPSRSMHCGLGELYFAISGKEPGRTTNETGVTELTLSRSTLKICEDARLKKLKAHISGLDLSPEQRADAVLMGESNREDRFDLFRETIASIEEENDMDSQTEFGDLRPRSVRVAACIRRAAKLLPA